jgi:transposase
MWIIGCDLHTREQQIAALDTTTGTLVERRVEHAGDAVRRFYAALPRPARVGIGASGTGQGFEKLLAELGRELWVGDAAEIRASVVRQQRTDVHPVKAWRRLGDSFETAVAVSHTIRGRWHRSLFSALPAP